jgi:hypothetical protein
MSVVPQTGSSAFGQVPSFQKTAGSVKFGAQTLEERRALQKDVAEQLGLEAPQFGQSLNATQLTISRMHSELLDMVLGTGAMNTLLGKDKPVGERIANLNRLVQTLKSSSMLAKRHNIELPNISKTTIFLPEPGEALCTNDTQVAVLRLHKKTIDLLNAQNSASLGSKPAGNVSEKLQNLHQLSEALRDISALADFHHVMLTYDGTNTSIMKQLDTKA